MNLILFFTSNAKTNAPTEKLLGVKDIAEKFNWHVQTAEMPSSEKVLAQLIDFWHPIGIIMECGELSNRTMPRHRTIPTVFIDQDPALLPRKSFCVIHDSYEAGQTAARHLMMTGHDNFAFIPFPQSNCPWSDDRRRGFVDALALNGHKCRIMESHAASVESPAFLNELREFVRSLPRACAILVANDRPAETVLIQAKAIGLKIPSDLAVLGVDDCTSICDHTVPTLSSVKPDFRRGGALAAMMLAAILRDGRSYRGNHVRKYGTIGIVKRASTHPTQVHLDSETEAALEYIRINATEGLKAETVMKRYTCSRTLAAIKFRKATGHSILEEIHATQLDRIKALLADPKLPLKTISAFCGFNSANSLRKFFHRETGMTMTAWRRTNL